MVPLVIYGWGREGEEMPGRGASVNMKYEKGKVSIISIDAVLRRVEIDNLIISTIQGR